MSIDFKEMIVHVPLCSHPDIKKVLLIDIDGLDEEFQRHHEVEIKKANLQTYSPKEREFEVVIVGDIEALDAVGAAKITTSLAENGVIVCGNLSWDKNPAKTISQMKKFAKFNIILPYMYGFGLEYEQQGALLFCSNKYHPTADIILQKSDLLDGLKYYNSEIHLASFTLPTSTKKAIREALKI